MHEADALRGAYLPPRHTAQSARESCAAAAVPLSERCVPAGQGMHVEFSLRAKVAE